MQRLEHEKQVAEKSRKVQLAARVQQEDQADRNAQLLLQVCARSLRAVVCFALVDHIHSGTHVFWLCMLCLLVHLSVDH